MADFMEVEDLTNLQIWKACSKVMTTQKIIVSDGYTLMQISKEYYIPFSLIDTPEFYTFELSNEANTSNLA